MPKAYILVGPPTSGKSTWAWKKQLMSYVISSEGIYTLSRDMLRGVLFGKSYKQNNKDEELVSKHIDSKLNELIKSNYSFIVDNCHCRQKYIDELKSKIPSHYEIEMVYFPIPLWKAYYRNVVRWVKTGKFIPFKVIKNMKKGFDKLKKE